MNRNYRAALAALSCVPLLLAAGCTAVEDPAGETVHPEIGVVERVVEDTGIVVYRDPYSVIPVVSGKILSCTFEEGDAVAAGQTLYVIDSSDLEDQITQAKLSLDSAAEACRQAWFRRLSEDLKTGRHLTIRAMKRNFQQIARDFSKIPTTGEKKQRIGILGDIYTKYCHLGNWDIVRFLEQAGCETYTGGLSWYVLYYLDSPRSENRLLSRVYGLVGAAALHLQKAMIASLRSCGFYCAEDFATMKREAARYVSFGVCVGDGWLLGAEAVGMVRHQCPKVLAIHPFGCLPGHVCGKGFYPGLSRKLPEGQIVTVDVDASGSRVSLYNRAKMLADWRLRPDA